MPLLFFESESPSKIDTKSGLSFFLARHIGLSDVCKQIHAAALPFEISQTKVVPFEPSFLKGSYFELDGGHPKSAISQPVENTTTRRVWVVGFLALC